MKELEDEMRASGMTDDEIRLQRYYNTQLFRGCVDRKVPSSTVLYWRVRAVYVAYGSIVDSKTKAPLFNKTAWAKANNLLKEILLGYYSDPPGFELYNKRLSANGTVMTNQYGMEMIECLRGTNRTETYHKNLTTSFGQWNTGTWMAACLLSERRHRHNQRVDEKRRLGYPKIGHFDTWLIDLYQTLALKKHGVLIYPQWMNTSVYKQTAESFDIIPLQTKSLHEAVVARHKELDSKTIKLTRDQQYMCKAMDSPLPFLPFSGEKEHKAYAKFVAETDPRILRDDDAAAIAWCSYVNGCDVQPKLPTHLRTHHEEWNRNQRVKECVSRAASKNEMLEKLNSTILPTHVSEVETQSNDTNTTQITEEEPPVVPVPTAALNLKWNNQSWNNRIMPVPMFPAPQLQAINAYQHSVVGGTTIGNAQSDVLLQTCKRKRAGRKPGSKDCMPRKPQKCKRCVANSWEYSIKCVGRLRGKDRCEYFTNDHGDRKQCGVCNNDLCKGGENGQTCEYM